MAVQLKRYGKVYDAMDELDESGAATQQGGGEVVVAAHYNNLGR